MKKKIDSSEDNLRKRIYEFFLANKSKGKITTVKHFEAENIPRSTIYDIIKRAESNAGYIRTIGSGRKPKIMTKKAVKRLEKMVNHKSGVSQSQAARKFGCSQQFISKTLKNKTSIKYRKKKVYLLGQNDRKSKQGPNVSGFLVVTRYSKYLIH